ncbi:MAG: hypothetical protein ACP5OB_00670 [Candidatus Ratteibacteria bacterium]
MRILQRFLDAISFYSFGKYKFDISSIDFNKLDFKVLKKQIENYPVNVQKEFYKIWRA